MTGFKKEKMDIYNQTDASPPIQANKNNGDIWSGKRVQSGNCRITACNTHAHASRREQQIKASRAPMGMTAEAHSMQSCSSNPRAHEEYHCVRVIRFQLQHDLLLSFQGKATDCLTPYIFIWVIFVYSIYKATIVEKAEIRQHRDWNEKPQVALGSSACGYSAGISSQIQLCPSDTSSTTETWR